MVMVMANVPRSVPLRPDPLLGLTLGAIAVGCPIAVDDGVPLVHNLYAVAIRAIVDVARPRIVAPAYAVCIVRARPPLYGAGGGVGHGKTSLFTLARAGRPFAPALYSSSIPARTHARNL